MPDIEDFKKRLEEMRKAINERLPAIAETLTLSAKALAERNIKEKGFGAVYSSVKIPAWFLHGKELNQRGTKFLENHGVNPGTGKQGEGKKKRRKKKDDPDPGNFGKLTNWGEFRQAQGLQADHVDGSYSNKMWANMQVTTIEQKAGGVTVALLGGSNREAQKKMNFNRERYGDFIRKGLTEESGRILGEVVTTEIGNVLERFFIN